MCWPLAVCCDLEMAHVQPTRLHAMTWELWLQPPLLPLLL
jgi:hypothetical protein